MNCICVFDPNSTSNTGKIEGFVSFHQCKPNTMTSVQIRLKGFAPNTTHGIHIHSQGDLSQGCASACDHYNPFGIKHGSISLYGNSRHVGDLCNNVTADFKGEVNFQYFDDLVDLFGQYSVVGRSVVLHEKPDDLGRFREDLSDKGKLSATTGNAGARIACAVIGLTNRDLHPYPNFNLKDKVC